MDEAIFSPKRLAMPRVPSSHPTGSLVSHPQTRLERLSLPTLSAGLQPLYRHHLRRQQPRSAPRGVVITRYLQRRARDCTRARVVAIAPLCPPLAQAHSGECLRLAESDGAERRRHGDRRDVSERGGKKAKSTAIRLIRHVAGRTSVAVMAATKLTGRQWSARSADEVGSAVCAY